MMKKKEIEYPCPWTFRIIGTDETRMFQGIGLVMKTRPYELTKSNESRTGKYISLNLETEVESESIRNDLFHAFLKVETVKMVL